MPRDLFKLIESNPFIVGDGAMGTMLQQKGLTTGGAPELWNVERPDIIKEIYQSYVDAGSQIIETNTFGGTRYRLGLHNLQDRVHELNLAGAALAREVAGEAPPRHPEARLTHFVILRPVRAEGSLRRAVRDPSLRLTAPLRMTKEKGLTASLRMTKKSLASGRT